MTKSWLLNRRTFLRAAGVSLALPMLQAMTPPSAKGGAAVGPMRMVCTGGPFAMVPDSFFPTSGGRDYKLSPTLEPLAKHRQQFTVFSNLDHGITGGHNGVPTFLNGIHDTESSAWPDRNMSVDQRAAEHVGAAARYQSLVLAGGLGHPSQMSWTRSGVNIPPEINPIKVFNALFKTDDPATIKAKSESQDRNRSILDAVNDQAKKLSNGLGRADQRKMDEYLTSVRGVEVKIDLLSDWINKPKPKVEMSTPINGEPSEKLPVFYDLIHLAFQTDSSRVASIDISGDMDMDAFGGQGSYHGYSHHGKSPDLLKILLLMERFQMTELARFLDKLSTTADADGRPMLDRTMVLFGSGMGNSSSHSNKNLPIILAGGGFKHGSHLICPAEPGKRLLASQLYLSMLQRFGVETDRFNKANKTLAGLEVA